MVVWGDTSVRGNQGGKLVAVSGDEPEGTLGGVALVTGVSVGMGVGVTKGEAADGTGCGVEGSSTSERQRTRDLRTGAYGEDFENTGVSGVSGIRFICCGGVGARAHLPQAAAGIGTSLDVEEPSY